MSEVPVQVVIAAFEDERAADEVLRELKQAKGAGVVGIQNAAVLRRTRRTSSISKRPVTGVVGRGQLLAQFWAGSSACWQGRSVGSGSPAR